MYGRIKKPRDKIREREEKGGRWRKKKKDRKGAEANEQQQEEPNWYSCQKSNPMIRASIHRWGPCLKLHLPASPSWGLSFLYSSFRETFRSQYCVGCNHSSSRSIIWRVIQTLRPFAALLG